MTEFATMNCPVCGGKEFQQHTVLWPELVAEWGISPEEHAYIDEQQGLSCQSCEANLRAMTLAHAILSAYEFQGTLEQWARSTTVSILEMNAAYNLTSVFQKAPGHRLASYPEIDMQALPYANESFDLIVHSDTLEHVSNPGQALSECRRVLNPTGYLAYTIPIIVGRMTRSRIGTPASYHGGPGIEASDHLVHTEFGADFWTCPMQAGFKRVQLISMRYPASVAILASRT
jgi:SAM-dependent methyltransferase